MLRYIAIRSCQHSNENSNFVRGENVCDKQETYQITLLSKVALHLSGAMFQCLCLYFRHPKSLSSFSPFPMSSVSDGFLLGRWRLLLMRLLPLSSPSSSSTQALSTVSMKLKSCCTLGSRNSEASSSCHRSVLSCCDGGVLRWTPHGRGVARTGAG